jgi:hypothetical protein
MGHCGEMQRIGGPITSFDHVLGGVSNGKRFVSAQSEKIPK